MMDWQATLHRLAKHSVFNLAGTVVDTLVLWFCAHYLFETYFGKVLLAPLISFECANIVNYLFARRYVWMDRMSGRAKTFSFRHYLAYNASYSGVFLVKTGLLLVVERITRWDVVWCNLAALLLSGIINFILTDRVLFKKR